MSDNTTEVEDFDIKYWLLKILSFWYLFVLAFIISSGLAHLYLRYTQKTYRVSTSILVSDESSSNDLGLDALSGLAGSRRSFAGSAIDAEISMIQSFEIIQTTLKRLNFQVAFFYRGDLKDSEIYGNEKPISLRLLGSGEQTSKPLFFEFKGKTGFIVYLEGAEDESLKCEFGKPCISEHFSFVVNVQNENKLNNHSEPVYARIYDLDKLTVRYIKRLNVEARQSNGIVRVGSNIIDIDIAGPLIEKNTTFLNEITQVFIEYDLEERNSTANRTINFIDLQLNTINDSLDIVEDALEAFRAGRGIIDLSSRGELLLTELTRLESERAIIDLTAKYYDFLSESLSTAEGNDKIISPSTAGISDPTLIGLIGELNLLTTERVKLSVTEGSNSVQMMGVEDQIASVKLRIQESIRNGLESNKISYQQIDGQLEELRAKVGALPKNERDLLTIQRRFNLNNELYTFLLKKKSDTEIARAGNKPKVRVLDKARDIQATFIGPKSFKIYLQSNVVGFLVVLGILSVSFFFRSKIMEIEQIKEKGNVTILGRIPHVKSGKNKDTSKLISSKDPLSEAFRGIRLNLDFIIPPKDAARVIGVTSAESGEGKTFNALNIANVCALADKKTLLIGLDLRKPRLQEDLGLSNTMGLTNFLAQNASYEDIIQKTDLKKLDVIVSGPVPPNPAELLTSERFSVLMTELSSQYDYIICDGAPMGLVTDYLSALPFIDITLFIVRLKYSKLYAPKLLMDNVSRGLIKNAHIVINDVGENASKKYGYGYGYGYGETEARKGTLARIFKR